MKTVAFELNVRALFFVFAFALVGCQQEEFYEKEYLENPFNPPTTVGGTDGGSSVGGTDGGSSVGGTDGGSSVGGTDGGSSVGGTDGGSSVGGTDGGSSVGGTDGGSSVGGTDGGSSVGGTTGGVGTLPQDAVESFTQVSDSDKKLDILWVVDDSGSMGPFQTSLANNFELFINDFIHRGIDFQMGITTTDCSTVAKCGAAIPGSLESLTAVYANANPQAFISTFKAHIKVGTKGSGIERGLRGAEKFLDRYAANWFRGDSRLVIVFVSDEEDQSQQTVQYYLNRYLSEKSGMGADYVRAYSILNLGNCNNGGGVLCGTERYSFVSNNTDGLIANLHSNFATTLTDMGADIQNLVDSFSLANTPINGTVVVSVNGTIVTEWTIDGRNLTFNQGHIPAVGSSIQVSYQY
jgi:hypothetical protein